MQSMSHFIITIRFFFFFQILAFLPIQSHASATCLSKDALDSYVSHVTKCLNFYDLKDLQRKQDIISLLLEVREQEEKFPDAYPFFTAQDSSFFAYQTIAKELYEHLEGKKRSAFEFLRYPSALLVKNCQELFEKVPDLYFNQQEGGLHTAILDKAMKLLSLKDELASIEIEALITDSLKEQEQLKKKIEGLEVLISITQQEQQQLVEQFKSIVAEEIEELERVKPTSTGLKRLDALHRRLTQLSINEEKEKEEDEEETLSDEFISDVLPDVSRQLISVSYSMETFTFLDSAFFVFMAGKGVSASSRALNDEQEYSKQFENCVRELFEVAGISSAYYEPYLEELIQTAPCTKEGILNQIFIPQERVREFFYPSVSGGFFSPLDDEKLSEILFSFREGRFNPDFDVTANKQGRLIAGALFDEEVKIFRYTLIPEWEQKVYQEKVKQIIEKILYKKKQEG